MQDFINTCWITTLNVGIVLLAEYLFHKKNIQVEHTRKLVQIGIGLLSLFLPSYIQNQWLVLLMAGLFQLALVLTYQYGYLQSIHGVKRKTYGSLVFPIMIFLVYIIWFYSAADLGEKHQSHAYFYLPVLIISIADPFATIIGRRYPVLLLPKLKKSIGGSLSFWGLAFIITIFVFMNSQLFSSKDIIWVSIFIATLATLTELYSRKGLGILFIPLVVLVGMYVTEYFF